MELPPNLEELALYKFDQLLLQGKLLYSYSEPERVGDHGFPFEFRICPALGTKPSMAGLDPVRSKATSPFVNPDPDFLVAHVGPLHTLILSKFCVYRPSYILHTNEYVPQKHDLSEPDIAATWLLLDHLKAPQMVIFNCGAEAGASQGHKHIQLLPRPTQPCLELFPDRADFSSITPDSVPGVPYKHYVIGIPMDATATDVAKRYYLLLETMRNSLGAVSYAAYNMVMVKDWIMIIPRRHAARETVRANAAGMMGLVWVQDMEERNGWTRLGMTNVLTHMGIPTDGCDAIETIQVH